MLKIRANNAKGFYEIRMGGVVDVTYPTSKTRRGRVQENGTICPTLTCSSLIVKTEFGKDTSNGNVCSDRAKVQTLRCVRNEYAKQIRKAYDNHEITERRCNLKQWEPRTDDISNTISTVLKDNYLLEYMTLKDKIQAIKDGEIKFGELTNLEVKEAFACGLMRVRKLTPRECGRLMGVPEKAIDAIENSGVSKSQQYKAYGNSIVVDVMYHCFLNLFGECTPKPRFEDDLFPGY